MRPTIKYLKIPGLKSNAWRITALFIFSISYCFADYQIKSYTINNGGEKLSSNRFEMSSSIGQIEAQKSTSNNTYEIKSGFWKENTDLIFKSNFK